VPAGRPTEYIQKHHCQTGAYLAGKGYTEEQIAEAFGVDASTIWRWKQEHQEFCNAIKSGKDSPDDLVERSLYERATGYTFKSEKIFQYQGESVVVPCVEHVPPDTTAQIFWLKNRRPKQWRDKQELEHTGEMTINIGKEFDKL
jgi:transcriptional regulator with XRE-family HTH domain